MCGFPVALKPGRHFDCPLLDTIENGPLHRGPDSGGIVGEIYNFHVLRTASEQAGRSLHTIGDTEVILEDYLARGEAVVERLDGMAERYLSPEIIHRRKVGLTLPLDQWAADPGGLRCYLGLVVAADSQLAEFPVYKHLNTMIDEFRQGRPGPSNGRPPIPIS